MPRYFLEVSYMGGSLKGFQIQPNVPTVQGEIEKAFAVLLKMHVRLTTSSRTDAGVHALQNFFHFDVPTALREGILYNLNAILSPDISLMSLYLVNEDSHSRFDAISRTYKYYIYQHKNPFLLDRGWHYPFSVDVEQLQEAAQVIMQHRDFTSFSKRNTQVHSFICNIMHSSWTLEKDCLVYTVESNRFLRGMVRALVATMLKVGRGTISVAQLTDIILSKDCTNADFSAPGKGLFLKEVHYPVDLLNTPLL